jgi:uncharacterized membrane protein HdeD (DUF308 family)
MLEVLARNWWLLALRGACGIAFGLATLFWPRMSIKVLVLLFGAYAFVDGVFALLSAVRRRDADARVGSLVFEGLVGILVGVGSLFWPGVTAMALLFLIAGWAVVTGVMEIAEAIRLRRELEGEWLLALAGVASLAFGALLVLRPLAGALAVLWLIGVYSTVFGALLVALALFLRGESRQTPPPRHAHA